MSEKIYAGSGRIITTKFGEYPKITFSTKDLETLNKNLSNGWVSIVLKPKKETIEGKPTHYAEIDNWKPNKQNKPIDEVPQVNNDNDDLPF